MRIANTEHRAHHWRIDDVTPDFELEDVWALPVTGGPGQFPELLAALARDRALEGDSGPARWLFGLRMWLGRVFGWDRNVNRLPIPGCTETSVRDRLPESERAELPPVADARLPFRPVYRDHREACMELSNDTVHALMHLSWVPEGDHHRARMAVYVKTRGRLGRWYMALIAPFRHFVVYPAMLRRIGARWQQAQACR
jgi:hypothetical protein